MKKIRIVLFSCTAALLLLTGTAIANDACVDCHNKVSPGQVQDWQVSEHSHNDVTCSTCHGTDHQTA
ncbi:multiheme c-type cytochrome, partial [Desulfocastanea catecholica]